MHKFFAKTQFLGKKVIFLPQCHSTNDEAYEIIKSDPLTKEGLTVITSYQTNGRGQMGNKWESKPRKNAMFSFVLKPKFIHPEDQFQLQFIISTGIRRALIKMLNVDIQIKWPNDIFVTNKKIGGILIENSLKEKRIESSIIGIGINVNQVQFNSPHACSIKEIIKKDVEPNEVIENILVEIEELYAYAKLNGIDECKKEYISSLYQFNQNTMFKTKKDQFEGKIVGISNLGLLLIDDGRKIRPFSLKEVELVKT